jgi:poly(3-hydroxybutyrate) depolymerase
MISGATAYRGGEYLYQDWLLDDRGLTYPSDARYAGNAADIVEVRVRMLAGATAIRITYNTMVDPDAVASTISLGDSAVPYPMPHGAGASARAAVFVTAHGCTGDAVRAIDGRPLAGRVQVRTDHPRRQVEVRIPFSQFDPRGKSVHVGAASGLWHHESGKYLRPDPAKPAFFNAAFRAYGPWVQNTWMDASQSAALTRGDLSPLHAVIDFESLAQGVRDDTRIPRTGPMNRILVSHFEPVQGRGSDNFGTNDGLDPDLAAAGGACSGTQCTSPCELPHCTPAYSQRLQPYSVYVPRNARPASGFGLVVSLHGAGSNYNHFEAGGPADPLLTRQMLAEAGHPSIMVMPQARGPNAFYKDLPAADVFEVMADIASYYRLDPRRYVLTGSSMGGYGTYKFGVPYPDLWGAIIPNVPAVGARGSTDAAFLPEAVGPVDPVFLALLKSLRHVPVLATQGLADPLAPVQNTAAEAQTLQRLGYRQDHWWFDGTHEEFRYWVKEAYAHLSRQAQVERSPRHVTYVVNGGFDELPELGMRADHAYWTSGLVLRVPSLQLGTLDAHSHGAPGTAQTAGPVTSDAGDSINGSRAYVRQTTTWTPGPQLARRNLLEVTATNVAAMTVHVERAGLGCDADLKIVTDGPLEVTLIGRSCRTVRSFSAV